MACCLKLKWITLKICWAYQRCLRQHVVTEVGQHQMVVVLEILNSQANMLPLAGPAPWALAWRHTVGVQLAKPDKDVIWFAGDGSFRMNTTRELITVKRYNLLIKIFLFDNQTLGMVRQWQKLFNENVMPDWSESRNHGPSAGGCQRASRTLRLTALKSWMMRWKKIKDMKASACSL